MLAFSPLPQHSSGASAPARPAARLRLRHAVAAIALSELHLAAAHGSEVLPLRMSTWMSTWISTRICTMQGIFIAYLSARAILPSEAYLAAAHGSYKALCHPLPMLCAAMQFVDFITSTLFKHTDGCSAGDTAWQLCCRCQSTGGQGRRQRH